MPVSMTEADNRLTMVELIFPEDTNTYGTAFAGRIVSLMTRAASLVSSKQCRLPFVTASIDSMEFSSPIQIGEVVEVRAHLGYISNHTAGVMVEVYGMGMREWEPRFCSRAYFFMVSLDEKRKPVRLTPLPEGDEQDQKVFQRTAKIHAQMLQRKKQRLLENL